MPDYEIISIQQLQALLQRSKGARFATITAIVTPDLKKDCPFKDVVKISTVNVVVNFDYGKSVNRQREREDKETDFQPEKRKWGTRLTDSPFVSHVNGEGQHKLYLETKVERVIETLYKDGEGKVISKEEITPFLKKKNGATNQGVEKEIVLRDYDVNNIAIINIDGKGFLLRK